MRNLSIIILLVLKLSGLNGQEALIELTFKAQYESWFVQYVPLDSVLIQNLTQGGDTMLVHPDTTLVLDITTGLPFVQNPGAEKFGIIQNYPNPFSEMTTFKVYLDEKGSLDLEVRNVMGQTSALLQLSLETGMHRFNFYPGSERLYLLTANFNGMRKSMKMVANGTNQSRKGLLVHSGSEQYDKNYKSQKLNGGFLFSPGDQLMFTSYAKTPSLALGSDELTDNPATSQVYTFEILEGIRCPGEATVLDIDGNEYNTVQIGGQCWMKENLKTTTYSNGVSIPEAINQIIWANLYSGGYVMPYNGVYGALYNGYTLFDTNGICPVGWHVPDINEWSYLTNIASNGSIPDANKLKSCRQADSPFGDGCNTTNHPFWFPHNIHFGTDAFGFSGLPGGNRSADGVGWIPPGQLAHWWSATEVSPYDSKSASISYASEQFYISNGSSNQVGMSVRCIRDGMPEAQFSASATEGTAPFTVSFSDLSIHKPVNWSWDFGDGGSSTQQNPSYMYNAQGVYSVQLIASNIHGADTILKTNYIIVNLVGPPVAAFTGTPVMGLVPLTVSFTDESAAIPLSHEWDFGDGNMSTAQNPDHTYSNPGSYTVRLVVTNNYGFDTLIKKHYIIGYQTCPGVPTVNYEGQVYNTVLIGTECWLKENLNTGVKVIGSSEQTNNGVIEKYCYHNDDLYCDKYGGLYQWDEMMGYSTVEGAQGICPLGWHIPTDDEWKILEGTVDSQYGIGDPVWDNTFWRGFDAGLNLKSTEGWWTSGGNGTDHFGFTGLPGGVKFSTFSSEQRSAYWWSSSESTTTKAWTRWLSTVKDEVSRYDYNKIYGLSVRCIKNN
jgi:uncharacterized protein (TIGR02145 family)